jgi:hypothetical protein
MPAPPFPRRCCGLQIKHPYIYADFPRTLLNCEVQAKGSLTGCTKGDTAQNKKRNERDGRAEVEERLVSH